MSHQFNNRYNIKFVGLNRSKFTGKKTKQTTTKPTYTRSIALIKKEISCQVFLFIVKFTDPKTTNC